MNMRLRVGFKRIGVWLIPLSYALAGILSGMWVERLANTLLPQLVSSISVASAVTIYSAVASGMLALTGIVFSLMFVLMQVSASTYSPRLMSWVSHDRVVSHALGVFTATFLYALTALAWVDRGGSGRVSMVGVVGVTALLLASIVMFISLTQRVGLLQINRMLVLTATSGRDVIDGLYPPIDTPAATGWTEPLASTTVQRLLYRGAPLTVQMVDVPALIRTAAEADCVIELRVAPGDTVLEATPLARLHGNPASVTGERVTAALQLGSQRTVEQDPAYAIRLLVDIAIRALSPAINDPTTAVQALDHIGDLLIRLGRRRLETSVFRDAAGAVRVVMPVPSWEDLLRLAFDEIRACGATSVQVMRRMNALVTQLLGALPEERRASLLYWRERLHGTVERAFPDRQDALEALAEDKQGLGGAPGD